MESVRTQPKSSRRQVRLHQDRGPARAVRRRRSVDLNPLKSVETLLECRNSADFLHGQHPIEVNRLERE
jgi:hypothetical protein